MERLTTKALFLTLFALWLVAGAMVVFLLVGRGELNARLADADQNQTRLGGLLAEQTTREAYQQATRAAMAIQGTAAAADAATVAAGLASEVDALNVRSDALAATAAAADSALAAAALAPPQVAIIAPAPDALLEPGVPVQIVVAASDAQGLAALNLSVAGDTVVAETLNNEPFYTLVYEWTPAADGTYDLAAQAIDSDGQAVPYRVAAIVQDVAAANNALRAAIEANVLEIRGVTPISDVVPTVYTRDQLQARFAAERAEEDDPAQERDDVLVYYAFDFLPRDFALSDFYEDFLGELVAGFYDPETDEMVVVGQNGPLDLAAQWTYAHEYMHALQDQRYGLEQLGNESQTGDEPLAFRAFVEGEAELVQTLHLDYFTAAELRELRNAPTDDSFSAILASTPPIILAQTVFPFTAGADFQGFLLQQGGFDAIDAAWSALPVSTEQILHPERYVAGDEPLPVPLPPLSSTLGAGWRLLDEDVLGEFYLREYLAQYTGSYDAAVAAAGWGGDRYAVYLEDETGELVMVLRTAWDREEDRAEFMATMIASFASRYGAPTTVADGLDCAAAGGEFFCLATGRSTDAIIIRAPSTTTATAVLAAIGDG